MRKRRYYKPNMTALRVRKGKAILDFLRNQPAVNDADIKADADACIERIKKLKEKEKHEGEN